MARKKLPKIGDVVAVKWLDHHSYQEGGPWVEIGDVMQGKEMICLTYGRVVGVDKDHIVIAGTDGDILHPERGVVSDVNKLLKSAITGWKKLL